MIRIFVTDVVSKIYYDPDLCDGCGFKDLLLIRIFDYRS